MLCVKLLSGNSCPFSLNIAKITLVVSSQIENWHHKLNITWDEHKYDLGSILVAFHKVAG